MKKMVKIWGMALLTLGLTSCGASASSSSLFSSVSISSEPSIESSSEPSIEPSSEPSSSSMESSDFSSEESSVSSSVDRYEGRIHKMDMTVVDLSDAAVSEDDPRYRQESKPIERYRREQKIDMYYLDQIDDIYYVSLESFVDLFEGQFVSGLTSLVKEEDGIATWTLSRSRTPVYSWTLDAKAKTFSVFGVDMNTYIIQSINSGQSGVGRYMSLSSQYLEQHPQQTAVYPFAQYSFNVFQADGHYRYPFALLSAELSKVCDRNFLFCSGTQELFEYGAQEQIDLTKFKNEDGTETPVTSYIQAAYDKQYGTGVEGEYPIEPLTLREFNQKLFFYIMDNYYGIADEKGIISMRHYLESYEASKDFLSENGTTRGNAYFKLVQMLNDLHTSYSYSPYFGEFGDSEAIYSQTFYRQRMDLYTLLTSMRESSVKAYNKAKGVNLTERNVRYSSDGRYGYFSFDDFYSYQYFGGNFIPREVLEQDAFNLVVNNLEECRRSGVERVIIDDSCNRGGYVYSMAKILALLTKDNSFKLDVQDGYTDSIMRLTTRVDSNKNDIYNEEDCFGNDFEFYIVTSNFSYSCGNAFPVCAASSGLAKIIGQKSGGGECCVFHFNFPSGQKITYSSPFHLGFLGEDDTFRGAEVGTFIQYGIGDGFYNLYDVDALAAHIEETDSQGPGPFPM